MVKKWKVIFREDGKLRLKRFREDLDGAKEFYRELRAQGVEVHLVCANHGFAPFPKGHKRYVERPSSRHLWCPYCMKYQIFKATAIRTNGILGDVQLRCPICTIPVVDYWVQRYNGMTEHVDLEALKKSVGAW